jgi:O-antigen ligase
MSFTALLWSVLYLSAMVGSIANPLFGAIGYLLEYYMRPQLKWWGHDVPDLRYNLIISIVLGVTFLARRQMLRPMVHVPNIPVRWLIALATVMLLVTVSVSVNRDLSWFWGTRWVEVAIIFPMLVAGVVRTRGGFNLFVAAHMAGAFWWGWDAWNNPRRQAGRLVWVGSGDSLNDNAASAHLLTVLPFIAVYLLTEKDKRLRAVALVAAPFVINTLILCNSRGAMVALAVSVLASVLLIRSGRRLRVIGAGIAVAVAILLLADKTFINRQQTTTKYEEDGSAMQRLETWRGAFRLIKDRPLGAGGRGFHLLSPRYIPWIVEAHGGDPRAPHNTWVMVACEWGILGFICFVGLNGSTLWMLEKLKRRVKALGDSGMWYYWRALAIQIAIIAGLVAAVFTDRLYGESGYWMIGLAYALTRIQVTDAAEASEPSPAPAVASAGTRFRVPTLAGAHSR